MPVLKNQRHERFAQLIAKGSTASAAYVAAGYRANDGNAAALKGNQRVKERVAELHGKAAERAAVTKAAVMAELAKIGFANMADYMRSGAGGDPYLDFSALSRDQAAALQEVTVDSYTEGAGDEAREVKRVKFKLADKRAALVDLGKHLGMFVNRHVVARRLSELSDAELEMLLADDDPGSEAGGG